MLDSSAGFTLDTGTMLSPDANWIAWENRDALSPDDRRGFARICPDFVVALLSPTDRLTDTMRKMEHWLMAGTKLGWLIAPSRFMFSRPASRYVPSWASIRNW